MTTDIEDQTQLVVVIPTGFIGTVGPRIVTDTLPTTLFAKRRSFREVRWTHYMARLHAIALGLNLRAFLAKRSLILASAAFVASCATAPGYLRNGEARFA